MGKSDIFGNEERHEQRAVSEVPPLRLVSSFAAGAPACNVEGGVISSSTTLNPGVSRDVVYHARRAVEEAERALGSESPSVRMAHEGLAQLHLRQAADLRRKLQMIIAPQID